MIKRVDALSDPPEVAPTAGCTCSCTAASDSPDRDDTMLAAKTLATVQATMRSIDDPEDPPG